MPFCDWLRERLQLQHAHESRLAVVDDVRVARRKYNALRTGRGDQEPIGRVAMRLSRKQRTLRGCLSVEGYKANARRAQRLHRSARTVDHHLAAIFAKLNVATDQSLR